jgi:FdhD protein
MNISIDGVFGLVEKFQYRSPTYRATGGTHLAALCDTSNMPISAEDIGSHNALDRVPGGCIPKDMPTENRIVLTSGRSSSDMLLKVAMRKQPRGHFHTRSHQYGCEISQ